MLFAFCVIKLNSIVHIYKGIDQRVLRKPIFFV